MISKFPHINKINDVILILRQYFLSLKFPYKKEMRKKQKQNEKQVNVNEKALVNVCMYVVAMLGMYILSVYVIKTAMRMIKEKKLNEHENNI